MQKNIGGNAAPSPFRGWEFDFVNGETVSFTQRQLTMIDWSPHWPAVSGWCQAAAVGAVIGIGLGLNPQVWPWTLLPLAPRVTFWLVLSLLIALQWMVADSLLPVIGRPGLGPRIVRSVLVLFVLTPFVGIEGALVTTLAGIYSGTALPDMSVAFAAQFLRWGAVLALPVVIAASLRNQIKPALVPPADDTAAGEESNTLPSTVIALKAEDHYVRVFTEHGDTLVLMRFADAVARVAQADGIQVHRSYWVRVGAVKALVREGRRRYELHLSNGQIVPVSRAFEARVKSRFRRPAG